MPGPPVLGPAAHPPYQPGPPATPYPVTGYQAPPTHGPVGYPPRPPGAPFRPYNNTVGLLSMIFGIVSLPLMFCCYIGLPLGIAAVIMGGIGVKKVGDGQANNRGQAIAGMVCGGIAICLTLLLIMAGFADGFTSSDF